MGARASLFQERRFLSQRSSRMIMPKYMLAMHSLLDVDSQSYHHKVKEALDESLDKLGLDYIDLYLMHWPQAVVNGEFTIHQPPSATD